MTIFARDEVGCPTETWPRRSKVTAAAGTGSVAPKFPCPLTKKIIDAQMQYVAAVYDHTDPAGDDQALWKGSVIADVSCQSLVDVKLASMQKKKR